jgi:hypothetical protein
MSKIAIVKCFLFYFLIAFAFGLYEATRQFTAFNFGDKVYVTIFIGAAIGRAASIYLISGIIPMIAWAILRFRSQSAGWPLFAWAVLGIAMIGLNLFGEMAGP